MNWAGKETLKVNPLQDTIVALRPIVPDLPFDIPNSIHLLDVTMPDGAALKVGPGLIADPNGIGFNLYNHKINFGWEYLWHCHILAHEENDMMRPILVAVAPDPVANFTRVGTSRTLRWMDNSTDEVRFIVQTNVTGNWTTAGVVNSATGPAKGTQQYTYLTSGPINRYYRVVANNLVGDTTVFPPATVAISQQYLSTPRHRLL